MKCWFTLYDLHGNILSTTPEKEKITGYNISDNFNKGFNIFSRNTTYYGNNYLLLRIIFNYKNDKYSSGVLKVRNSKCF